MSSIGNAALVAVRKRLISMGEPRYAHTVGSGIQSS